MSIDFSQLSLAALRELSKEQGIYIRSTARKQEVLQTLINAAESGALSEAAIKEKLLSEETARAASSLTGRAASKLASAEKPARASAAKTSVGRPPKFDDTKISADSYSKPIDAELSTDKLPKATDTPISVSLQAANAIQPSADKFSDAVDTRSPKLASQRKGASIRSTAATKTEQATALQTESVPEAPLAPASQTEPITKAPRATRNGRPTLSAPNTIQDRPRTAAEFSRRYSNQESSMRYPLAESTEGNQESRASLPARPQPIDQRYPNQRSDVRMRQDGNPRQDTHSDYAMKPEARRQEVPVARAYSNTPRELVLPQNYNKHTQATIEEAIGYIPSVPRGTPPLDIAQLDSGETKEGILEIMPDGFGFLRCANFLPGENDVYVSAAQIRKLNLKTGDMVRGNTKVRSQNEKFSPLLYVKSINSLHPYEAQRRKRFEELTPIFPNERIHLETFGCGPAMRMVDLVSPIGKGQRGMIVSQPKAGKTTLLKQIARAVTRNHKNMHLIILLIDERPEEVTDMKESIEGDHVEVIYSTFDELPENHKRVSEMVIERAKRLVEHGLDVMILLDSITRLARAYNLTVQSSGRTLSGGLDPAALHMPKKFFGAARNMREGGSLTILATALVETGSRMDDVVFEEFKGTGNMELVLDRSLSERRVFPAIDLPKSSTRRDDLLLTQPETEANFLMRKAFNSIKSDDAIERIINMFLQTKNNAEFVDMIKKTKIIY